MLQWYAVLVILLDIGIIIEISFHLIQRWYKLDDIFKKSILWFNGRSNWFDYWLSFVICECIIVTSNVWSTPINYSIFAMSVAILSFFPRPIRNRTDKRASSENDIGCFLKRIPKAVLSNTKFYFRKTADEKKAAQWSAVSEFPDLSFILRRLQVQIPDSDGNKSSPIN